MIKFYRSTDVGAPTLNRNADTLLAVLDACLVTGYGSKTLSSLVVASGVATATVDAGHDFAMLGTPPHDIGPVVVIDGATPSVLNAEHRIVVTSLTQFTFPTTAPDGAATGTITAKIAPLGWETVFTATNKRVYRSLDVQSIRHYLRIEDTGALIPIGNYGGAHAAAYESMSDIDTGAGRYPATGVGNYYFWKSPSTLQASDVYLIIGDTKTFYGATSLLSQDLHSMLFGFGDVISFVPGDAYASAIFGSHDSATSYRGLIYLATNAVNHGFYLAAEPDGLNVALAAGSWSAPGFTGGQEAYPARYGAGVNISSVAVIHNTSKDVRGKLRGLYSTFANDSDLPIHETVSIEGRRYLFLHSYPAGAGGVFVDLEGWENAA